MNSNRTISLLITVCITVFSSGILSARTGTEIIKNSEQKIRGNSQAIIAEMTIKTRRWTRKMKLRSYEIRKQRKSFAEILSPKKDAGNRFLLIKHSMWHYVPRLQQTIKIAPSMMLQSWMGSDFSNDDIVKESSILKDYTHTLDGKKKIENYECNKVILTPKPDSAVVWGKIVYYARVSDDLPVKVEYYNEHGKLKKVMSYSKFKKMHDRVIPTLYKMQTVSKKNRYTIFKILRARFDTKIPGSVFSLQNLKRR